MPAGCNLQPYQMKKMTLAELATETDSFTSGNQQTLCQKDKGIPAEAKTVIGAKRQIVDDLSTVGGHQHIGCSPTNGHLVYVRRKVESEYSKVIPFDSKMPVSDEFMELKSIKYQEVGVELENMHKDPEHESEEVNLPKLEGEKLREGSLLQVREMISMDHNEKLDKKGEIRNEMLDGKNDETIGSPAFSGESTSASHDIPKAVHAILEIFSSVSCSSLQPTELTDGVIPENFDVVTSTAVIDDHHISLKADKVFQIPEITEPVFSCSLELQKTGSIVHNGTHQLGVAASVIDGLNNKSTNEETDFAMSVRRAVDFVGGERPSDDYEQSTGQYWKERFVRLQAFLESCDQSNQEDYIRKLRLMPAAGRSRQAYELERRAMHLLLEEGKELQKMRLLNVLGKTLAGDRSSHSTHIPKQMCQ